MRGREGEREIEGDRGAGRHGLAGANHRSVLCTKEEKALSFLVDLSSMPPNSAVLN